MRDKGSAFAPPDGQYGYEPMPPRPEKGLDIVFVVDGVSAEGALPELAKDKALALFHDINELLLTRNDRVNSLRVRLIVYRGQQAEAGPRVQSRGFFNLPEEADAFRQYADSLRTAAATDEPRGAVDALLMAIQSDWRGWSFETRRMRQVIMVMAGQSALPPDSPAGMPGLLDKLEQHWMDRQGKLSTVCKGMVLFAPMAYPWNRVGLWELVAYDTTDIGTKEWESSYSYFLNRIYSPGV